MKKFLQYFLVFLLLINVFVSVKNLNAEEPPKGTCVETLPDNVEGPPQPPIRNITEEACKAKGRNWSWTAYYNYLAPLPCDPANNTPENTACDPVTKKLTTFDPVSVDGASKIGEYLNIMIKIFIGICAVLAVIMIIMGGIEYMSSDLISSKEQGRNRITGAILGLILALGAWTLLNTINPDLLKTDLSSLQSVTVTVTLEDERENQGDAVAGASSFSGATALCKEGITRSRNGIYVCASIAQKLDAMIDAAKTENLNYIITGGGYRSPDEQIALRIKNCNGDTTNRNPNPPCNPPTALPGNSRHNHGLAVDFKCRNELITNENNACFQWLKRNAATYGFKNLASEPWHWSIDGK